MTDPRARVADQDFIKLFETVGPTELSNRIGISLRGVFKRRNNVEGKIGRQLMPPNEQNRSNRVGAAHPHRIPLEVKNGIVLVGSDGHYWPGPATPAHRAFVKFIKELRPAAIVFNGDALDGARISRHAPIGWEKRPMLVDEIEVCKERLHEIALAGKPGTQKIWTLGNHDGRFETRIATMAPEYAKIHGVHLRDHFPAWQPCWAAWINDSVVVKHRWKGGLHATHNNAVNAGASMVTAHLHSLKVTPFTDYTGTRFGVDTGCLADPEGAQFVDYTEDGPKNWRAGFAVLTFYGGRLLWPEVCHVIDPDHVEFRGKVIKV